jgi:hypothetical protein
MAAWIRLAAAVLLSAACASALTLGMDQAAVRVANEGSELTVLSTEFVSANCYTCLSVPLLNRFACMSALQARTAVQLAACAPAAAHALSSGPGESTPYVAVSSQFALTFTLHLAGRNSTYVPQVAFHPGQHGVYSLTVKNDGEHRFVR